RERYQRGRRDAVSDLLQINPEFINERWVKEALVQMFEQGWPKRRAGRPAGHSDETRFIGLMIAAYVHYVHASSGGSREKVFNELAKRNFENLDYSSIRRLYYQTRNEPRLRPLFFERLEERATRRVESQESCIDVEKEIALLRREGESTADVPVT